MNGLYFDRSEILRTWNTFRQLGEVLELRIPKAGRYKTISGYFDDPAKLADAVVGLADEPFAGIYFTINPVKPALLARAANKYVKYAETTTSDADIIALHWLPVDLDAKRPAGISATDGEHDAALQKISEIRTWLIEEQVWPVGACILADSGNGGHLNIKIDLPNLPKNVGLVKECLEALDFLFSDDKIQVDITSQNPARIWKLYGTMAKKGDNTTDRPHRLARLIEVPEILEIVSRKQLENLAAMLPKQEEQPKTYVGGQGFDPIAYCKSHSLSVHHTKSYMGGTLAVLEECIFDSSHKLSACIIGWPNGAKSYRCRHHSCLSKHWANAKAIIEPHKANLDSNLARLEETKQVRIKQKFQPEEQSRSRPKIDDDSEKKESAATRLANLARKNCLELWHTPEGEAYITLHINNHKEYKKIKTAPVKAWLSRLSSDFLLETSSGQTVNSVATLLEGIALFDGKEHELYIRKAEYNGKIYIDIGDPSWQAIEISEDGWEVISDCPVKFRRPKSLLPLMMPEEGGSVDDLRYLVNVPSEESWIKYTSWLSQAFWCRGPFMHLYVRGPQGSAKSALAEITKSIVDPSRAPKRHLSWSPRELMMACHNEAIPSFDNVSNFADDIADTICIISTGGSSAARELYTDSDEALIYAKNPMIMNGIADPSQRGDLLDRLMILDLEDIAEDKRISEKEMKGRLDSVGPKVLGLILDATVTGLLNIKNLSLKRSPRMADFAMWAISCSSVFGWDPEKFISIYQEARAMDQRDMAEGNRFMVALANLADKKSPGYWEGTSTKLLEDLNIQEGILLGYEPEDWPRKAQAVGTIIRRLIVPAKSLGVTIRLYRSGGKNLIEVKKDIAIQRSLDTQDTQGYTGKNDVGATCATCVSFLRESISYRKRIKEDIKGRNKETFGKKPTQDTQDSPITKTPDFGLHEGTQNG